MGEALDLMRRIAESHRTMLIVTHEMQFAREIADRILFREGGRVVQQEPPAAPFDAPRASQKQVFLRRVS